MSSLFTSISNNVDYLNIKNNHKFKPKKAYLEKLWEAYEPFADPNFKEIFAHQPHERFWEMYLGAQLLSMGCKLQPKSSADGPDFNFKLGEINVWVEAIAPGEGEGDDRVPTLDEHGKTPNKRIPDEKIILRFTNAITEKFNKFQGYIGQGLVSGRDARIIAINGGNIELHYFGFDYPFPLICKAVYEIGPYTVRLDVKSGQIVDEGLTKREEIIKKSKSPVPTGFFVDPKYSSISGILYSNAGLLDFPDSSGDELLYLHNKIASVQLSDGWMGKGMDYWRDNDNIHRQRN